MKQHAFEFVNPALCQPMLLVKFLFFLNDSLAFSPVGLGKHVYTYMTAFHMSQRTMSV